MNDAPVVTGAVTSAALEDGSSVSLDALANASGVDSGATLSVTNLPGSLPPGVTYDAQAHSFTLDPSNPAFQHLAAGDHTTVTVNYEVIDGTATTAASVSWSVAGTNDAPVISSNEGGAAATLSVDENSTSVTTVTATDADDGAAPSYSIVGGTDASLFTMDATSGALTFISAPDSEASADSDSDNLYHVTVRASDGVSFDDQAADADGDNAHQFVVRADDGANGTAQGVTVTVTDLVENHVPTDLGLAITNSPGGNSLPGAGTVLGAVAATDPDAGDTFTFSLLAGSSSGFSLNAGSGSLTTTSGLAERSTYTLDIQVTDAAAATYHEVFNIITGTNGMTATADDNPLPSGGPANPALAGDDVLYGSGGNDVIYGGSGNDWIFGQNGLAPATRSRTLRCCKG